MNPFVSGVDWYRQLLQSASEAMERSSRLREQTEIFGNVEVGTTPSSVVYTENKLELLRYEPLTDDPHPTPILIVYALINRPYILDLQPDRSVVRRLLEHGFEVYLIDWNEPSVMDAHLTLDDYVNRYIENCVDVLIERSAVNDVHLLGYCMGGTMGAMYAALHPEKVRTLGLMAAGLCFDGTGGVLERWGDEEFFSPDDVVDAFDNVPAEFLDLGFALMDPVQNLVTKYVHLFDNLDDDDFVRNFARMERWLSDGIDVPGAAYAEFLKDIYQENKLMRNELRIGGELVDLERIDMPILQIIGQYDHLIPPESSKPFNDVVSSTDTTTFDFPTGHIGLSVSSRSHADLWPKVGSWFEERTLDLLDLQTITGIGPAYEERLRSTGVDDLRELADSDPEDIASAISVSTEMVRDWIDQAERLRSG